MFYQYRLIHISKINISQNKLQQFQPSFSDCFSCISLESTKLPCNNKGFIGSLWKHISNFSYMYLDTLVRTRVNRMHCKMVFNFTVRHDHAFKSYQTRWPLIGLRNLINNWSIGQLLIWWKQTKAFFHTLADVNNLNTECYVIQSKKCKQK